MTCSTDKGVETQVHICSVVHTGNGVSVSLEQFGKEVKKLFFSPNNFDNIT